VKALDGLIAQLAKHSHASNALSNLVAHQGDFVVGQWLLTQPVRARDLLERRIAA
jgi:hypothetical protein